MTDDLERDLRDLLRRRADAIVAADLPAWSPPDPASPDRRRSFGPLLAAAAAVVLVAAILTAVIHDRTGGIGSGGSKGQANGPGAGVAAPPKLPAAPSGTRAVSSLGIQLFVPDSWTPSSPCQGVVDHPGAPGLEGLPVYSCPMRTPGRPAEQVSIQPGLSTQFSCAKAVAHVTLARRDVCIAPDGSGTSRSYGFSTSTPVPVTVVVTAPDRTAALAVLRSARSADPDVHGCPVRPAATITAGSTLAASAVALSVCAYVGEPGQRAVLTTSGAANGDAAGILAGALVNDESNGTPASCSATKSTNGRVVVTSRDRAGRTGRVVLMALPCGGLAFVAADGHARLLTVSTKQLLAGALN